MDGLELRHVSHAFGKRQVVRDVSLHVPSGQILCLLGPSGCGKTTTLRVAAGLEVLQAGEIRIDGRQVAIPGRSEPPERRSIGMVFQDYALFPHLTVLENVTFGLGGRPAPERRADGLKLLARLGMSEFIDQYPHRLSGGEQQRVALARAMAPRPKVMLLDEPFANLDVRLRDAVRDDALSMLQAEGTATLMVTHDPDEAMRMADRLALMKAGSIVQVGTSSQVYEHPESRFAAEFFTEINVIPGLVKEPGKVEVMGREVASCDAGLSGPVDVVVRPDAVYINGIDDGVPAQVVRARRVGATRLVDVDVAGGGISIRGKWLPEDLPEAGERVGIRLNARQTFVFPRDNT